MLKSLITYTGTIIHLLFKLPHFSHNLKTALIQTTLDGAAQKWFSVLPIDIKSDWKIFTQEFSKLFDFERNEKHQRLEFIVIDTLQGYYLSTNKVVLSK